MSTLITVIYVTTISAGTRIEDKCVGRWNPLPGYVRENTPNSALDCDKTRVMQGASQGELQHPSTFIFHPSFYGILIYRANPCPVRNICVKSLQNRRASTTNKSPQEHPRAVQQRVQAQPTHPPETSGKKVHNNPQPPLNTKQHKTCTIAIAALNSFLSPSEELNIDNKTHVQYMDLINFYYKYRVVY